ncbi:hypothetical protein MKW94_009737 [Papaver nudicaule]|uniref:Uncharacterized protein n=1 Tax=Papaver nudicaule TaxID=74823 RepID=A0AA41SJ00_PAPNU|nr:hypothetical protein [Papaver nudicaule]
MKTCGVCGIQGHNRVGCKGAPAGAPSTIGRNNDGDGEAGSSSRPQRATAGIRTTGFGIDSNSRGLTNGGVLRGGIPPFSGRGAATVSRLRAGGNAVNRGRGGGTVANARVRGRGGDTGANANVRGRGSTGADAGRGTATVRGRGVGRGRVLGDAGIGTQSSQTSTVIHQPLSTTRGRGIAGRTVRMRGGGTGIGTSYPVENMSRRSASLLGMSQDQPQPKKAKRGTTLAKWF